MKEIGPKMDKYEAPQKTWGFKQPGYDQRSSCFVNAGSEYGVGHKQPVGHSGKTKQDVECLPRTPKMFSPDPKEPR